MVPSSNLSLLYSAELLEGINGLVAIGQGEPAGVNKLLAISKRWVHVSTRILCSEHLKLDCKSRVVILMVCTIFGDMRIMLRVTSLCIREDDLV